MSVRVRTPFLQRPAWRRTPSTASVDPLPPLYTCMLGGWEELGDQSVSRHFEEKSEGLMVAAALVIKEKTSGIQARADFFLLTRH